MNYTHKIVIGDWSDDGHNQKEIFTFQCSHDEKLVKKAYKDAVKKCKVSLHDQNGKGGTISHATPICCNYQDHKINPPELKALKDLGVNFDCMESEVDDNGGVFCSPVDIAYLFFEMVKTQIPGFWYKIGKEKKRTINGFWSKDFNFGFGYGTFS